MRGDKEGVFFSLFVVTATMSNQIFTQLTLRFIIYAVIDIFRMTFVKEQINEVNS